jgi:hypothetical protein
MKLPYLFGLSGIGPAGVAEIAESVLLKSRFFAVGMFSYNL